MKNVIPRTTNGSPDASVLSGMIIAMPAIKNTIAILKYVCDSSFFDLELLFLLAIRVSIAVLGRA